MDRCSADFGNLRLIRNGDARLDAGVTIRFRGNSRERSEGRGDGTGGHGTDPRFGVRPALTWHVPTAVR